MITFCCKTFVQEDFSRDFSLSRALIYVDGSCHAYNIDLIFLLNLCDSVFFALGFLQLIQNTKTLLVIPNHENLATREYGGVIIISFIMNR